MTNSLRRFAETLRFGGSAILLVSIVASCASKEDAPDEAAGAGQTPAVVKIDRRMYESPQWIDNHAPDSSSAGYTLVLYKRRVPMLIDMDGEVVHAWPGVRAAGRARLLPTGHLAILGEKGGLEEYDWQGRQTWSFALPDPETFLHHDFIQLENGNYLLLAHDPSQGADLLLEVGKSGDVLWTWNAAEHLADDFSRAPAKQNKTHINSVHELPPNRWFEDGMTAFRPGNILISARNLNAVYIIARPGGAIVWQHSDDLDYQHEAMMIPPGTRGAGNILLFNNGYHNLKKYRQSAVIELNPVDRKVVWEYRRKGFFSSTGGTQQALPNGNLLVTSSQGGRVFELTRDGRVVWQWSPPFLPMRATRYERDHCPQLKALDPPSKEPIERRDPDRFIDENLYAFSLPHEVRRVTMSNRSRNILKNPNRCQILQFPRGAEMALGFGTWADGPETPYIADEGPAHFLATLRLVDGTETERILDRTVDKSELQTQQTDAKVVLINEEIPIDSFYDQTVELCLSLSSRAGGPTTGAFVWAEPMIRSPVRRAALESEDKIDPEALEKQEKHLKAIGYIN